MNPVRSRDRYQHKTKHNMSIQSKHMICTAYRNNTVAVYF